MRFDDRYIYAPPVVSPVIPATVDLLSVSLPTGTLSSWGVGTIIGGSPSVVVDTVTGLNVVRLDAGNTVAIPAGMCDFMHSGPSTLIVMWRETNFTPISPGGDNGMIDSSGAGATHGFQMLIKESSGQYREVFARLSDGAGFPYSQPGISVREVYTPLKWNITAIVIDNAHTDIQDDHATIFPVGNSTTATFPGGVGGNMVIGGRPVDIMHLRMWNKALSAQEISDAIDADASAYGGSVIQTLWGDGTRYFGFASIVKCTNGDVLVVCRNGTAHSGDLGWLETRRRPNGSNLWGPPILVQIDASLDSRDPCLSIMSNGDIMLSYFLQNFQVGAPNPLDTCWVRRSTDNGHTWGSPVQGTAGQTNFEACSSRLIDVGGGVVYWPIYGQNIGDAHSSAFLLKSTDGGASFSSHTTVANGVTDAVDYTEPGILHLAGGAGYLYVCREDTNGNMQERTSTDAVTWGAPTNFPATVPGNMAARLVQLASGRVIEMYRPGQYAGAATILTRSAPGTWNEPPVAYQLDATPSPTDYGDFAELTAGHIAVAYGVQYNLTGPSDVRYRELDEWLLDGDMPRIVTPASASVTVSTQTQFTARGAGGFVWSLHTNASGGSINSSTGLYTAGTSNGSDVVRVTDRNGFFTDANVTVSGATWNPATPSGAFIWSSVRKLLGLNNGDPIPTLPNQVATSFPNPPGTITGLAKIPAGGVASTYVTSATPGGQAAASFVAGTTTAAPVAVPSGNQDLTAYTKALFFATFKTSSLAAAQVILGQAAAGYEWSIEGDGAGKLRGLIANASTGKSVSNASVVDGNWHYVIVKWDGTTVTMLLDGVAQTVTGAFTGSIPFHGDDIALGAESSTGTIDAGTVPSFLTNESGVWLNTWSGTDESNLATYLAAAIA